MPPKKEKNKNLSYVTARDSQKVVFSARIDFISSRSYINELDEAGLEKTDQWIDNPKGSKQITRQTRNQKNSLEMVLIRGSGKNVKLMAAL